MLSGLNVEHSKVMPGAITCGWRTTPVWLRGGQLELEFTTGLITLALQQ